MYLCFIINFISCHSKPQHCLCYISPKMLIEVICYVHIIGTPDFVIIINIIITLLFTLAHL